jgi:D-xylose transport system substrate-binding protein
MYLLIPDVFFVPVYYGEGCILDIEKIMPLQEYNYHNNLTNELANRKDLVIGVSFPSLAAQKWVRDKEAMEEYAKEKAVLKIEINDFDAAKQALQVENLISQGIDVLIITPIDILAAAELVEKAHKAGIKVISYEHLVKNSDVDLFIAFNNIRVGQLQGLFLIGKVPRGNYIIMSGDPDAVFKEGAMEYIQPLVNIGNIKVVADKVIKNWDPKIAFKIVKDALIANKNKINAILAPNDATAGAAIEALQPEGLAGKVVVTGQDADLHAIRRILQGTQSMTVLKDSRELAKTAIDAAIKLVSGKVVNANYAVNNGKVNIPSILVAPILIDKNNIDKALISSGYYIKEEVYTSNSN